MLMNPAFCNLEKINILFAIPFLRISKASSIEKVQKIMSLSDVEYSLHLINHARMHLLLQQPLNFYLVFLF